MKNVNHFLKPRFIISRLILTIILFGIAYLIARSAGWIHSDFSAYWLAGFMTRMRLDYYDANTWIHQREILGSTWNPPFVYPVPLALLFTPLSFISLDKSFVIWVFLSQLMIIGTIYLIFKMFPIKVSPSFWVPIISGIILFRPVIVSIRNGQIGPLLLFLLAAFLTLFRKEKLFLAGIILALLSLKPNLGIPILILVALWLITRGYWRCILGVFSSGSFLFLLSLAIYPEWIVSYLRSAENIEPLLITISPSIWGVSANVCGLGPDCYFPLGWIITSLFFTGYIVWIIFNPKKDKVVILIVSTSICLALIFVPYVWAYDQILLIIPIVAIISEFKRRNAPYLLTATFMLFIDVISIMLLFIATRNNHDAWSAFLPILVLLAMGFVYLPELRQKKIQLPV